MRKLAPDEEWRKPEEEWGETEMRDIRVRWGRQRDMQMREGFWKLLLSLSFDVWIVLEKNTCGCVELEWKEMMSFLSVCELILLSLCLWMYVFTVRIHNWMTFFFVVFSAIKKILKVVKIYPNYFFLFIFLLKLQEAELQFYYIILSGMLYSKKRKLGSDYRNHDCLLHNVHVQFDYKLEILKKDLHLLLSVSSGNCHGNREASAYRGQL